MILPGMSLGMLGGGQLGRMFASEARRMGFGVVIVDPDPAAPAAHLASEHLCLPWDDPTIPERLAATCGAVTTEWENVPAALLRAVAAELPLFPSADAVATTQDRIAEKRFLNEAGIPTVRWTEVDAETDLAEAWRRIGGAGGILKTARNGYDGKGQVVVRSLDALRDARTRLGVRCILEELVALDREISVMVCRDASGATGTWTPSENVHVNGILHTSLVPASISEALARQVAECAVTIARALEYVGVMGVECFLVAGGTLLVNELAPRPHNSGHWTLDVPVTSQFEQQVRIVAGLPLGATQSLTAHAQPAIAMINILGDVWPADGQPDWSAALALPGTKLHLYGKRDPRPGRKMGHLTATAPDTATALATATKAWHLLDRDQRSEIRDQRR